jgi:hypothetical protein
MNNKAYDQEKGNDSSLKYDEIPSRGITTLGDFWPDNSSGARNEKNRRLEPASKAVTVLGNSKNNSSDPGRRDITLKLAPIEKPAEGSEWYETYCSSCIAVMHIHRDWVNPPRYCKECRVKQRVEQQAKWIERPCKRCKANMSVCIEWEDPPQWCESCRELYPPKNVTCSRCNEKFVISSGLQIMAREKGWKLPTRCKTCRSLPRPSRSAGSYLSNNITNRYKTSRMNVRVRLVPGGGPSSGRRR